MANNFKQLTTFLNTAQGKKTTAAISGVSAAISGFQVARIKSMGLKAQAAEKRVKGLQAKSIAKLNNLKLQKSYNDTVSNQALLFSTQGRSFSSGSIRNIMREDQERLNWDKEYMKLSQEYQGAGILSDVQGFESAAKIARGTGITKGLLQLAETSTEIARIG